MVRLPSVLTVGHITRRSAIAAIAGVTSSYGLAAPSPVTFRMGGGEIDVSFDSAQFDLPQTTLIDWVKRAARAVTAYYGRFPVTRARIFLAGGGRPGVSNGYSNGDDGVWSRIHVG